MPRPARYWYALKLSPRSGNAKPLFFSPITGGEERKGASAQTICTARTKSYPSTFMRYCTAVVPPTPLLCQFHFPLLLTFKLSWPQCAYSVRPTRLNCSGWWRSKKDNVFTALATLTCSSVTYGFTRSIFFLDFCIYTKSAVQNLNCT